MIHISAQKVTQRGDDEGLHMIHISLQKVTQRDNFNNFRPIKPLFVAREETRSLSYDKTKSYFFRPRS